MDYEQDDQNQDEGVMQRIKESPRTVSALIIILIVAAAIYAFSGNKNNQGSTDNGSLLTEVSVTPEQSPVLAVSPIPTASAVPTVRPTVSSSPLGNPSRMMPTVMMTPVSAEDLAAQVKALPASERTPAGFVEKAQAGDGLTVLARRATTRWLNENSSGYAITNEHRIYIEDYIKDRLERRPVRIGQSETVLFALIKEAVESAKQLNERQLNHLSRYVAHVNF